jgi:hypothetical protein
VLLVGVAAAEPAPAVGVADGGGRRHRGRF